MTLIKNDFVDVTSALGEYRRNTGKKNVMLGGWDIEDKDIHPPETLVRALEALPRKLTNYAFVPSCFQAKESAAGLFQRSIHIKGASLSPKNIAVLPSGSDGLLLALTSLRDHGVRNIFVSSPNYFATFQICRHLGLKVEAVPTKDFLSCALDYERIAELMKTPCSAFVLSNPAYSVGIEYKPDDLKHLFTVMPENAYVLLDEVFLGLNWQHDLPWYRYDFPARVLILRSPSKTFLLYGLKVCFLIGPADIVRYVETLTDFLTTSLPGNFEDVAMVYIDAWRSWDNEVSQNHLGELRRWKTKIVNCFARNLEAIGAVLHQFGFSIAPIDSGPYVMAAIEKDKLPYFETVQIARKTGVLFMTSNYFYHESPTSIGFRINLCGDRSQFSEALVRVLPDYISYH